MSRYASPPPPHSTVPHLHDHNRVFPRVVLFVAGSVWCWWPHGGSGVWRHSGLLKAATALLLLICNFAAVAELQVR